MKDVTTVILPKVPKTVFDDKEKKWVVNDPTVMDTKVLRNPTIFQEYQDDIDRIMGTTKKNKKGRLI